jgi:hypothetical protein
MQNDFSGSGSCKKFRIRRPDPDPEAATNEVNNFRKAGLLDQLEDEKRKVEKLSGAAHQINGLQAALRYLQQFLGTTVALRYLQQFFLGTAVAPRYRTYNSCS